jgi:hypothetical protein
MKTTIKLAQGYMNTGDGLTIVYKGNVIARQSLITREWVFKSDLTGYAVKFINRYLSEMENFTLKIGRACFWKGCLYAQYDNGAQTNVKEAHSLALQV